VGDQHRGLLRVAQLGVMARETMLGLALGRAIDRGKALGHAPSGPTSRPRRVDRQRMT
jgi:hypothetical protein